MKKLLLVLSILVATSICKLNQEIPSFVEEKLKSMKESNQQFNQDIEKLKDASFWKRSQMDDVDESEIVEKNLFFLQDSIDRVLRKYNLVLNSPDSMPEEWEQMKDQYRGKKMYGGKHDFRRGEEGMEGSGEHDNWRQKKGGDHDFRRGEDQMPGSGDHDNWRQKRGGDHDFNRGQLPMRGSGDHDNWRQKRGGEQDQERGEQKMFGSGDHDNWRQKRGGDHDFKRDEVTMLGSGDHDNWRQKRGGDHDFNRDQQQTMLGGGDHDNWRQKKDEAEALLKEKKQQYGSGDHDNWRKERRDGNEDQWKERKGGRRGRNLEEENWKERKEQMWQEKNWTDIREHIMEKLPNHLDAGLKVVFSNYEELNNETSVLSQIQEIAKQRGEFSIPFPDFFNGTATIAELSANDESIEATKTIITELLLKEVEKDEDYAQYDDKEIISRQREITDEAVFDLKELRRTHHQEKREEMMKKFQDKDHY